MSPDRTQDFFHSYAGNFDAIYSNRNGLLNGLANVLFRRSMKQRFVKTIEGCRPIEGKTVLDVGCGPGHYSITLARRGARRAVGIDFAEGMLQLAAEHARSAGVADRCEFVKADFDKYAASDPFDYVVLMGFMDYVANPGMAIEKACSLAREKVFFSFPAGGGLLAWQRQLRYRKRCDLFLYRYDGLQELFSSLTGVQTTIQAISRDFFVTVSKQSSHRA